jgi:hypothetical protein
MTTIATRTASIIPNRSEAPWSDHEYVRGWGVFGLPFDSGHILALRVFPDNPFAPYVTVWHRDPSGSWSIYVDGPRLDTACPRYYAPACKHVGLAKITLTWTEPSTLRVTMDEPQLEWTVTASQSQTLKLLNAAGGAMPLWTWRPSWLVKAREVLARNLGMGRLELAGEMPSGHQGLLMPKQMFYVDESSATLDGTDLGSPTRLTENPDIGGVPLPARGVMAIGQAMWPITDRDEYERTRAETAP